MLIIEEGSYVVPAIILLVGGSIYYYLHDGYVDTKKLYLPLKTRYDKVQFN